MPYGGSNPVESSLASPRFFELSVEELRAYGMDDLRALDTYQVNTGYPLVVGHAISNAFRDKHPDDADKLLWNTASYGPEVQDAIHSDGLMEELVAAVRRESEGRRTPNGQDLGSTMRARRSVVAALYDV